MNRILFPAFVIIALLIQACGGDQPETVGETDTTTVSAEDLDVASPSFGIYQALRASGNKVDVVNAHTDHGFDHTGRKLLLNGSELSVYEFDSKEEADKGAATIAADGKSVGGTTPPSTGTPHWYRTEKVIVVSYDNDPAIKSALETVLGPQFAGGRYE